MIQPRTAVSDSVLHNLYQQQGQFTSMGHKKVPLLFISHVAHSCISLKEQREMEG